MLTVKHSIPSSTTTVKHSIPSSATTVKHSIPSSATTVYHSIPSSTTTVKHSMPSSATTVKHSIPSSTTTVYHSMHGELEPMVQYVMWLYVCYHHAPTPGFLRSTVAALPCLKDQPRIPTIFERLRMVR